MKAVFPFVNQHFFDFITPWFGGCFPVARHFALRSGESPFASLFLARQRLESSARTQKGGRFRVCSTPTGTRRPSGLPRSGPCRSRGILWKKPFPALLGRPGGQTNPLIRIRGWRTRRIGKIRFHLVVQLQQGEGESLHLQAGAVVAHSSAPRSGPSPRTSSRRRHRGGKAR